MVRDAAGTLERISTACNRCAEYLLLLLGLSMTATVILQVFSRYILNHSLFWSEELARYLLVWLTFIGATVAYHRNMHPGVDFLFKRLDRKKSGQNQTACSPDFFSILSGHDLVWLHFCLFYQSTDQPCPGLAEMADIFNNSAQRSAFFSCIVVPSC